MEAIFNQNKKIDLQEVVSLLGISSATVRNWIRHNYLTPDNIRGQQIMFDYSQINDLKNRIATGQLDRLNKRANKKHSRTTFIPDEYAGNNDVINLVQKVIDYSQEKRLGQKSILFAIILNLLKSKNLISYSKHFNGYNPDILSKNKAIKQELKWWTDNLGKRDGKYYTDLLSLKLPELSDILGLIYQSIVAEGDKAQGGSYYTPKKIVDGIVSEYVGSSSMVLDPCCGTGQFLLSASEKLNNPSNVWGFDIDETAVRLARINLLLKFPNRNFSPHIYHKNTLIELQSDNTIPRFDVVITNPPWGAHFSQSEIAKLQQLYPSIKSNEPFSFFLKNGIELLKEGGVLSFILPEAILNVKVHKDIRSTILEETTIRKIKHLDRLFKNVFTPVIRLDIKKSVPVGMEEVEVERNKRFHKVSQARLKDNSDYIFDVFNNQEDLAIFNKTYGFSHITLNDKNAEWALGVVTGNNKKHLFRQRVKNSEPILTGKDIKRFITDSPKNFIVFQPAKLQQVAPESKYRAKEKLIYKFISKELVFAYDNKGAITLNSANILIPKVKNYPIKTILALFNSSLYQFVYQRKFNSIKVLRSNIEKLPLPLLVPKEHRKIGQLVDALLNTSLSDENRKEIYLKMDEAIMDIFSLTRTERDYIKSKVKMSNKSLKI